MNTQLLATLVAALPWFYVTYNIVVRTRRATFLDQESADVPASPPLVSVIVPARNEARNIDACLSAILSNTYTNLEVIVVDDQSTDGTGDMARRIAAKNPSVRVLSVDGLPAGWLGKHWACATGALAAKGDLLCFTDADTLHGPELVARSVNCINRRDADVFSVFGLQEMRSFWELAIQPQVFVVIGGRFGGTEDVSNSKRAVDKMANGQCLFIRRSVYEELGGHSLVREHVADDIMIAQRMFERGATVVLMHGPNQLSTRMYTSLETVLGGCGKNVYAGFRGAMPYGALGRFLYAASLLLWPVFQLAPLTVLVFSFFSPVSTLVRLWAMLATVGMFGFWIVVYRGLRRSPALGLISPIGAFAAFFMFAKAILKRQRVVWKNREYVVE